MSVEKKRVEYLVYIIFWGLFLIAPFGVASSEGSTIVNWSSVFRFWLFILPAFALFLINNFILMPLLLERKRRWLYFVLLAVVVVGGAFVVKETEGSGLLRSIVSDNRSVRHKLPMYLEYNTVLHKYEKALPTVHERLNDAQCYNVRAKRPPLPNPLFHPDAVRLLVAVIALVFNVSVALFLRTIRNERSMRELERQALSARLDYLKFQINPHFFMNTLNNIHALIDIDGKKAQKSVIELSKMMRYMLYETPGGMVVLEKEVGFLKSYIDLMRLRYTDMLEIKAEFPSNCSGAMLPSSLLLQFVENAFKHGVSYARQSRIELSLTIEGEWLCFECGNTLQGRTVSEKDVNAGIGIENARKRLSLLYGDNYTLDINERNDYYLVSLKLPLKI